MKLLVYDTVQKIPLDRIHLNNWNPNFCPQRILNAIEDDIRQNGFVDPITVQKYNRKMKKEFVIINGEHRYQIFKKLMDSGDFPETEKTIPATVVDCDDKTAMALTVRLNKEHGELLPDKVGEIARIISPKKDIRFLQKILFLEPQELHFLTDIHDKIHGDHSDKQPERFDDPETFMSKTEEQAQVAAGSPRPDNQALVLQGILKVQCPKCKNIIDVPK